MGHLPSVQAHVVGYGLSGNMKNRFTKQKSCGRIEVWKRGRPGFDVVDEFYCGTQTLIERRLKNSIKP